jgi:hypothetical protein
MIGPICFHSTIYLQVPRSIVYIRLDPILAVFQKYSVTFLSCVASYNALKHLARSVRLDAGISLNLSAMTPTPSANLIFAVELLLSTSDQWARMTTGIAFGLRASHLVIRLVLSTSSGIFV